MSAPPYICTSSGAKVDLLHPDPAQIRLRDIVLSLSKQCRFAGQTMGFYSVAEHSVLVSQVLPPELKLHGLLHDAAEAYTGDIISPLKRRCEGIEEIEFGLDVAIYTALGLQCPETPGIRAQIRAADLAVGALECRAFGLEVSPGREAECPDGLAVMCWEWPSAYAAFMAAYSQLRAVTS